MVQKEGSSYNLMTSVQSYKDLIVWQKSHVFAVSIYRATESFPRREDFGLTSQLRRAAVSIPSNIAEGYRRHSRKEYRQFLRIAFGSSGEVETQLLLAYEIGYLKKETYDLLDLQLTEILKMLNAIINKLSD